jgi:hypothetical protein
VFDWEFAQVELASASGPASALLLQEDGERKAAEERRRQEFLKF